jgi:uncharacterized protein YggT (Ycf19 family)
MAKPTDTKLGFIKFARIMTYLVYAFFIIATVFLTLGFLLLLFGANPNTSFVRFVYHFAAEFLTPFRGIFPTHQISDRGYFSAAGLFAIIFYGIAAMAIHALINYITLKEVSHQNDLIAEIQHSSNYQDHGANGSSYNDQRIQTVKSPRPDSARRI